tara:strand:- start:1728 stop:2681 length:954 start_codon:yes stop_codon:yes gene_type:complete
VAKKISNFRKFGKLASLVKKLADKNPDLKEQILKESKSKSKNSWNKIQKWTSTNLFQKFKERPLKDFTEKQVEIALKEIKKGVKPSRCFSVFKIPDTDLLPVKLFDLENAINRLDDKVQIQIDLEGGDGFVNTGIVSVQDLDAKTGNFNKNVRMLVEDKSDRAEEEVIFLRAYKKGKKGDSANCSSFVKVVFSEDEDREIADLGDRLIDIVVQTGSLSKRQLEQREKRLTDVDKKTKISRAKIRKLKTPSKVTSTKEDKKIEEKIKKSKQKGGEREKQIRGLIDDLRQDVKDGLITKKFFQQEVAKLTKKLDKGGKI